MYVCKYVCLLAVFIFDIAPWMASQAEMKAEINEMEAAVKAESYRMGWHRPGVTKVRLG
jgi:hypothetical protein